MRSRAVSETWRVESRDLSEEDFFADLPDQPFAFLYGEGRWMMLAEDPMIVLDSHCLTDIQFDRHGSLPPILPDLVGHIAYEFGYGLDPALPRAPMRLDALPEFHLALHRRVRLFDRQEGRLYTAARETERELDPQRNGLEGGSFSARFLEGSESAESYMAKVVRIREEIARGNVYQVNLTRQERWAFEGNLAEFARCLWRVNPAPHSAFIADADWAIVSSSPESYFRISEGRVSTRPIKGTAPRGADGDADRRQAEGLLASVKNRSELAMIVDLLRNDLSRVCRPSSVKVVAFPALESYANVHHLVAEIEGELLPGTTLGSLLGAVFPGGSITGCPKLAAMALIRELEPWPRSVYTGALGWCRADLTQGEFAIPIRTAWASKRDLRFGVGGGIVWDSDPCEEYEETQHKGRSLVQCLS